jgi:hypothetical protein
MYLRIENEDMQNSQDPLLNALQEMSQKLGGKIREQTLDKQANINYNRDMSKMKTYEDGVADEHKRIMDYLEEVGSQMQMYLEIGVKRKYKRKLEEQLKAIAEIIKFVEPTYFEEK